MWRPQSLNLLKRAIIIINKSPATQRRPSSSSSTHRFSFTRSKRPAAPFHHSYYYFCSSASDDNKEKNVDSMSIAEAKRMMRLVNVEALKDKLGAENKEVIPYDDLVRACKSVGVTKTDDEAAAFARILDEAGVILLFRDRVYLHPDKIVDLVRKAVPLALLPEDDPRKDELTKLQQTKEQIDVLAHKQVRRILWAGLGLAVMQVSLFFRLTFWEFSWDVMEPIAFFTTTTGLVLGYAYFMITSRDPTYQDLLKRLFLSRQRKLMKNQKFDVHRFVELQKQCKLNVESSATIKRRIGVEVEPEDLLHGH